MRRNALYTLIIAGYFFLNNYSFSQSRLNPNPTKSLIFERQSFYPKGIKSVKQLPVKVVYNQYFFHNTNQSNLENHNGLYVPKGVGTLSSFLLVYNNNYITLSTEPRIINFRSYQVLLPQKEDIFSVLNDVPLNEIYKKNINKFHNTGIKLSYSGISIGYGNWDQWWGPGIHNSLVMSNNAQGLTHYFIETLGYRSIFNNLEYKLKYTISDGMLNNLGAEYFLSAYYLNIRYMDIEFGKSRHILNGGYHDLPWSLNDAFSVLLTKKYMKYWDEITDYYLSAEMPSSGLKVFLELGFPKRSFVDKDPKVYRDHAMGSNLGLRKYGAFGMKELMFGLEYTRLVQGIYYNILPTPNWYDNIKYNYSSYNGRRWAAHSGSDSDDLLVYLGYMNNIVSFVYGLNYERHGVTYHFPPEVKYESKISASLRYNNTFIYFNYENEYFEHYGFVDVNSNIWNEIFESGSIQRTHTLLISIEHNFSF